MKPTLCVSVLLLLCAGIAAADSFGTGENQFSIQFVSISGDTNPSSGYGIVNNDYRIGKYEITNSQWDKFKAAYGPVTGTPAGGYDGTTFWTGANIPANTVSWYEAAQFVNWLNTSTGHQPAYKFTGTQGTSNYALGLWSASEAAGGTNLYRHKDAFYFLPTENEWVKAAYWNGTSLKTYAYPSGSGTPDPAKWNYDPTPGYSPWAVGSGGIELNGTYDMMGNMWEWNESPWNAGDYSVTAERSVRSGAYGTDYTALQSSYRINRQNPDLEGVNHGIRIAAVPEPATVILLGLGAWAMRRPKQI